MGLFGRVFVATLAATTGFGDSEALHASPRYTEVDATVVADQRRHWTATLELSVVMPCLNEARTVSVCVREAQKSLADLGVTGEVIVADNGSTDGSPEIAAALGARVIHVAAKGYGSALMEGIAAARGEYVVMGDSDESYDFGQLGPFLEGLRNGEDLVLGNRFHGGIAPGAMPFLHRHLGNPLLTRIARRVFRVPSGDVYCGLRGFRRSSILELDLRSTGMEFALEMVVKATLSGMRVSEVPATLATDGRDCPPHLRTWRDGWRSLRFLLLYSPRWLFLYPGLLLMALGFVVMVALLPGTITIGRVSFDAHTLLYASVAIVIGYQAIVFSAFARLFAMTEGLLPASLKVEWALRHITLEVGLVVGAILFSLGLIGSAFAVGVWESHSLGHLNYAHTLRIVIPSCTLLMLGSQTLLASFFLSILGLKRR